MLKKFTLILMTVLTLAACSSAKGPNQAERPKLNKADLTYKADFVFPYYIPNSGALAQSVSPIDNPKGIRVEYLAPRLVAASIRVQVFDIAEVEGENIGAKAKYMATSNIVHLRKSGVSDTTYLKESLVNKFGSQTDVAYQRVIRNDTGKVLHIYLAQFGEDLLLIQAWYKYDNKSFGKKISFDTFVNDLIKELENPTS